MNPKNNTPSITPDMWKKWNAENPPATFSAEETILWLEGMRQFVFEIWAQHPELRKEDLKIDPASFVTH